tara:strand:+ start:831 stop:1616 length:786 start_codon:yes stop_codon:yes gene_type:complete
VENKSFDKKISLLDWFIIFAIIIMFIMVYVPQSIWREEAEYKADRRNRMEILSNAEEFFYELTDEYTTDVKLLFSVVEGVMNEQISDSLFYGNQKITAINEQGINKILDVNIERDFAIRVDTTFSISEQIKKVVTDTIYSIGMLNEDSIVDTFEVQDIKKYKDNVKFVDVFSTRYEEREQVFINYLRRKFHLSEDLNNCPISKNNVKKKFLIEIDDSEKEPKIKILSPVSEEDKEWRYGIFRYDPGKQDVIDNGVKSWASK